MRRPKLNRPWKDGDTYLLFGLFAAMCLSAITWQAAHPGNWVVIADARVEDVGVGKSRK